VRLDEQRAPRPPADDPGVRPFGPILRPVKVRPKRPAEARRVACGAQAISTPGQAAPRSGQSPCPFPIGLAGSQCSGHDCSIRVSIESAPRVAHRPSVHQGKPRAVRVSPRVSSPFGSRAVSAQAMIAPSKSVLDQYPVWLTGPQYPMQALWAAQFLGLPCRG
jgi:hypothetical protein